MKILWWDRDGYAIYYKRLEEGTYRLPLPMDGNESAEIRAADLLVLLEGIDLSEVKRHKRYVRKRA